MHSCYQTYQYVIHLAQDEEFEGVSGNVDLKEGHELSRDAGSCSLLPPTALHSKQFGDTELQQV